jgi:adenylate cyclase
MAESPSQPTRPNLYQRYLLRQLRKEAGREDGAPLSEEDWEAMWRMHGTASSRGYHAMLARLPSTPRCNVCGAPFGGIGGRILRPLGYRPSRKNPEVCNVCVEMSPPGGMKMPTGVLFADLRGFTARSEGVDPGEVSAELRRFYRVCEDVLFPGAVIDKLIGDEVMALYLPYIQGGDAHDTVGAMVEHARGLMEAVGYGNGEPFVELGIGLDFGEAFVGNIGDRALYDFTAVGDVVNTAARLQGAAGAGEIILSARVCDALGEPIGEPTELTLKGKSAPEPARRLRVA